MLAGLVLLIEDARKKMISLCFLNKLDCKKTHNSHFPVEGRYQKHN